MAEQDRQKTLDLMRRLNESSTARLGTTGEYAPWLSVAASQILAITGEEEIVYVGHTLQDYDFYQVLNDSDDTAEGIIQAVTPSLLVVAHFSASRVKTRAVPLRETKALAVTKVRDATTTRAETPWPGYVEFVADIADGSYIFPALPATANMDQYNDAAKVLTVLTTALRHT